MSASANPHTGTGTAPPHKNQSGGTPHVQYEYMLDNILEGCQIIDFNFRYVYVNDAAAQRGRPNKQALIGHTMMEEYPGIEHTEMFEKLRDCIKKRTVQHIENEFTFPDGTKEWFELTMHPVPEGVFIPSLNIAARKKFGTKK